MALVLAQKLVKSASFTQSHRAKHLSPFLHANGRTEKKFSFFSFGQVILGVSTVHNFFWPSGGWAVPSIFFETSQMIVFIRGLKIFVVGCFVFHLFSFPCPSCFCFNSLGEKVKSSPALKLAELDIWRCRRAAGRSSAQTGPSMILSWLVRWWQWGWSQVDNWGERVSPQVDKWRSEALSHSWVVILPNQRLGHMLIFYFPHPTRSMTQPRHNQVPNTATHGLGGTVKGNSFWDTCVSLAEPCENQNSSLVSSWDPDLIDLGYGLGRGFCQALQTILRCHWDIWELQPMEKCN